MKLMKKIENSNDDPETLFPRTAAMLRAQARCGDGQMKQAGRALLALTRQSPFLVKVHRILYRRTDPHPVKGRAWHSIPHTLRNTASLCSPATAAEKMKNYGSS